MPDTSLSDTFAAWIGLAGVAVGAILSGGIDWWRSHITEGKERRREIGRAADDLGAGANSLKVAAGAFALADKSRQSLIAARGRSGGHKPKLTASQITHARQLHAEGKHTVADVAALFGGSRQTARD